MRNTYSTFVKELSDNKGKDFEVVQEHDGTDCDTILYFICKNGEQQFLKMLYPSDNVRYFETGVMITSTVRMFDTFDEIEATFYTREGKTLFIRTNRNLDENGLPIEPTTTFEVKEVKGTVYISVKNRKFETIKTEFFYVGKNKDINQDNGVEV